MTTTDAELVPRSRQGLCEFPGVECLNSKPANPGKPGRPKRYCDQEGPAPDGGRMVHNKANAHTVRTAATSPGSTRRPDGAAIAPGPVIGESTAARITLEQQMLGLPRALEQLQDFLTGIVENMRVYGDAEAVAAEVEQLQATHRVEIAEVERQRGEEEHRRRLAEQQAVDAEGDRDDADAAAEQALEELNASRAEAAVAVDAAEQAQRDAQDARDTAVAETEQIRAETEQRIRDIQETADRQIQQARAEVETARIAQATAEAERSTAQQTAEQLRTELRENRQRYRAELDDLRSEHRTERDQLRADHQAQLADVKQSAEQRVVAVTATLRAAEQMADDLRRQLAEHIAAESAPPGERESGRPRGSRAPE